MEPSETKHGQFSWNELVTTDPAAATKFYTELFGWTTQDFPMPEFTYTVVSAGGANTGQGGIMPTMSIPRRSRRKSLAERQSCHRGIFPK
jgi:predicted enzyme related to lactoylglutathione lyase